MNGLLDAMFNLQQSEILIYQRHSDGELEMEGNGGSRKREERRFFPLCSASPGEYQLERAVGAAA